MHTVKTYRNDEIKFQNWQHTLFDVYDYEDSWLPK